MGKLDSLRIDDCPYAFASFAAKHNALVDLLGSMVGENGISVVIAEKNAIIRANIAQNVTANVSGGGGITMANVYANLNANVANVVNQTGALANAYVVNGNIGTYPSAGKWVSAAGNVTIDGTRFMSTMPGRFVTSAGNVDVNASGFVMTKSDGKFCNIAFASLTHDLSVRTITMCNNNTAFSMDLIASALY
jgi:hypothetical protein